MSKDKYFRDQEEDNTTGLRIRRRDTYLETRKTKNRIFLRKNLKKKEK